MSISPAQCRAARAILGLEQNALAAAASVSRGVVIDFEKGRRTPGTNNLAAIRTALEAAGIQFLADGDTAGGAGVALKAGAGDGLRPGQLSAENDG